MIERHFIKVFGTTYMVEIETSEKVKIRRKKRFPNKKFLKTVLKTVPYLKVEKSGL